MRLERKRIEKLEREARFAHKNGANSNDLIDIFDKTIDKIEELFTFKLKTDQNYGVILSLINIADNGQELAQLFCAAGLCALEEK